MEYTYDLNTNGVLIITCDAQEQEAIRELADPQTGEFGYRAEYEALEPMLDNAELDWIRPEEIGALTDAPILGIRGEETEVPKGMDSFNLYVTSMRDGKVFYRPVIAAWGFMDYCLRSFLTDLIEHGKVIFTS